ncbi:PAS domain-containing sensor histidine kinase [Amaricoccus solimangrovi]|nr:PAS domain-containing protein [Amaricoccus solimangrovi]
MMAPPDPLSALLGASEMAGRIRAFDWSRTPLGPIGRWPAHLRAAVSIALRAPTPMVLFLGPDGLMIYNDPYIPIAAGRHPGCLGAPVCDAWPEIADFNRNVLRVVLGGGTLSYEDQELTVRRNGVDERIWISVDYSPIPDADGRPDGVFITIRETTENVRLRHAVASEWERLARMFEQAPSFMALLSGPEHVFELVNPAYRKLVGHRDVIGRTVRDALPEIEGQGIYQLLDRVYETGEPFLGQGFPAQLQPTPGAPSMDRLLDFVCQPIQDATGQTIGIFVEGIDITERVAAQSALSESEQRFRVFADTSPNHMWSTLPDGTMDWYNRRLREYFDLDARPLAEGGWIRLIHPADRRDVARLWRRSLGTGTRYEAEARLRRGDGAWRWHLIRAVPIEAGGRITRWIGTSTDVDDSRRAVAALRASETRLRLSQEVAGIASFEVGIADNRVTGSDALWALWGLEPRPEVDVSVLESLVLPEDGAARSTPASRLDGSATRQVEYRIRRADTGEIRWIARQVEFLRDPAGRPVRMFGVMRDITAAKEAEMRLRLLTHELSHRIKNILATVLALVSQTLRDPDAASLRELLTQRLRALAAAHDLLNDARWTQAPLREVVEAALAPFASERIFIAGPDVALGPKRALSLSLAVNELATNALKYGALSTEGEVRLTWERALDATGAPALALTWKETGGPPVRAPTRRGFGRRLIERVLAGDFAGEVRIDFAPSGLECRLAAPWAALSETAEGDDA